ncbi:MAG TPA: hypothetical protein VHK91_06610 [Flavisolibacter sp.]|nr:hypothetical protein [Flavisolibacter sp.]
MKSDYIMRKKNTRFSGIYWILILFVFESSCARSWTKKDEKEFKSGCIQGAVKDMGKEKAVRYCDCMLDQLKQRYSNPSDLNYLKQDTALKRLAQGCLQ